MSTNNTLARTWTLQILVNAERRHQTLVYLTIGGAVLLTAALAIYGWDYYILDLARRPLSPKHSLLKPSGTVGLKLGMLGLFLFSLVYLYPLRKRWLWLARQGKAKHWLDFHMLLGLIAPAVISFHSAFKISGFAGMAYWTMLALVISGLIGRYFYAQIPRNISAASMSLKEIRELNSQVLDELHSQDVFDGSRVAQLFHLPDVEQVQKMSLLKALFQMVALDFARPLIIWSLRRQRSGAFRRFLTLGGVFPTGRNELERAIRLVSRQASLLKRILFLSKTERVFYLWHVIHRPFSLSFAMFVIIHVAVVMLLGYF